MTTKVREQLMPSTNSESFPRLMISHTKSEGTTHFPRATTFYNPIDKTDRTPTLPELDLSDKDVRTSCGEWLVLTDVNSPWECILLNLNSMEKIKLEIPEDIDRNYYKRNKADCVLTAPPTDSKCILGFFSKRQPIALLWCATQQNWVEQNYGLGRLTQPTVCNGMIYGFKRGVVAVCEMVDGNLTITRFKKAPRSSYDICNTEYYLVGARGDIFWIQVGTLSFHSNKCRIVDVFKFNDTTSRWIQVRDIANDIFFLSDMSSISCSTENSNIKGNRIYFLRPGGDDQNLYTYIMEEDQLATCGPYFNATRMISPANLIWVYP